MAQGADTDGQPRYRIIVRINLHKGVSQHGLLLFSFPILSVSRPLKPLKYPLLDKPVRGGVINVMVYLLRRNRRFLLLKM